MSETARTLICVGIGMCIGHLLFQTFSVGNPGGFERYFDIWFDLIIAYLVLEKKILWSRQ